MHFPEFTECSPQEYKYYRDERCDILNILSEQLYIAMFCSQGMRTAIKCGVKVHRLWQEEEVDRHIVYTELPKLSLPIPLIMRSDGISEGWIKNGGRLWIKYNRAVTEGFLRQPGLDGDLCENFFEDKASDEKNLQTAVKDLAPLVG